ncbi:MDR family MFS transporter [Paenibacillus hexagrammi]|uniref:Multidrug efflux MFS transporter n=1 Tax=Paenibacillus hexagrammi TaxID=2908839 RepID=A0ABY3SK74_9BACL|nr:MDR family MFS transporter [Paenibacillus sp. YPD9-1]UJF33883.1 multidrug efflux MFS transporter [Paenibacillus sp. YPD9-1]
MAAKKGSTSTFWLVMLAIFFGNFMSILSSTTINVAFPIFLKDFHAELGEVQWMITGFLLATGVIAPVVGYFGDRWTYKRLYIFALSGFTLFSALCTLAWNIEVLVLFRILQGVFSGLIIPTTLTMVYQYIEKDRQPFAMSLWSLSSMLAPAFGPTLGGWMTEYWGWQSLFLLNVPIGVVAITVAAKCLPHQQAKPSKTFDLPGFVTVLLSSTLFILSFTEGNSWGWTSWKTIACLLVGAVTLVYFIRRELSLKEPLLNLSVFQTSRFTYSLIINCIITASLYSGTFLIPVFLQDVQHSTPLNTALVLLPGSIVMAVSSPIIGKLYPRVGPFWLIMGGIALLVLSNWELSRLNLQATHLYVSAWMTIRYVGIALSYMPVMNAGMSSIPKERSGHASAVTNWIRQATGALSIGVFSSLLATRSLTHQQELSDGSASGLLAVKEQGMTLGVQDVFLVAVIICLFAVPLTFILRDQRKKTRSLAEQTG